MLFSEADLKVLLVLLQQRSANDRCLDLDGKALSITEAGLTWSGVMWSASSFSISSVLQTISFSESLRTLANVL